MVTRKLIFLWSIIYLEFISRSRQSRYTKRVLSTPTMNGPSSTTVPVCTTPKPGKNGYLPPEACDVILYYAPSFGAAVFFCVLYGLLMIAHIAQGLVYKKV